MLKKTMKVAALMLLVGCSGVALSGCDDSGLSTNLPTNNDPRQPCLSAADCGGGTCEDGECVPDTTNNGTANNGTANNGTDNNGTDNNGTANNGTANNGTDCKNDVSCHEGGVGPVAGVPFDPRGEGTEGIVLDEDGYVTLDNSFTETHFIWIANTGQGTISKVDTRTFEEVGRYFTGPAGSGNDPSRTSVNTFSDVFVGNRGGRSVTKIFGGDCPDRNGDGVVTTSTGAGNVLPWGEDECVAWHTPLPDGGIIRAVAAQDTDEGSVVWAGGWNNKIVWKLDAETGEVLLRTESPVYPYGFALDKDGNLWIATYPTSPNTVGNVLGRLDTNRCVDEASCAEPACGDDGDGCVKQVITLPTTAYGITVDFKQRVWLAGQIMRYDPQAPLGSRLTQVNPGTFLHGITADERGWIYGAGLGNGLYRIDAEDPSNFTIVDGTQRASVKGTAVDMDGKVWAINQSHNSAFVVDPGAAIDSGQVVQTVTGFVSPYTYSDMTGSQLRFASDQRGVYTQLFEGCSPQHFIFNEWQQLIFDAEAPEGATIRLRARANHSLEHLRSSDWIELGTLPGLSSPVDLRAILEPLGLHRAHYLQLEVQLFALRERDRMVVPVLKSLIARAECPPIVN